MFKLLKSLLQEADGSVVVDGGVYFSFLINECIAIVMWASLLLVYCSLMRERLYILSVVCVTFVGDFFTLLDVSLLYLTHTRKITIWL